MKRLGCALLCLILLAGLFPLSAQAVELEPELLPELERRKMGRKLRRQLTEHRTEYKIS